MFKKKVIITAITERPGGFPEKTTIESDGSDPIKQGRLAAEGKGRLLWIQTIGSDGRRRQYNMQKMW